MKLMIHLSNVFKFFVFIFNHYSLVLPKSLFFVVLMALSFFCFFLVEVLSKRIVSFGIIFVVVLGWCTFSLTFGEKQKPLFRPLIVCVRLHVCVLFVCVG